MPFREGPLDPKTGKRGPLQKIPEQTPAKNESHFCGLCDDTGVVEEHQFCSCQKGQRLRQEESRERSKRSEPPAPTDDQKSAFDQPSKNTGTQLDLFDN
ncbi:MAG: hypothetical protein ACK4FA_01245 [Candidatus Paceibacteria bacterium]